MSESGLHRASSTLLRPLALASLVANIGIVVTGAAVRLTSSGLGCPTWPRCTDSSYVSTPEMGINGAIEFGNRLLTFVLIGGGPNGVEMAGSIAELAREMLRNNYHLPGARARVVVVEAGQRVLAEFTP